MESRQNEKCFIEYREDKKEIFGRDLTDQNNDSAFFTKSKRGLKKAWAEVVKQFTPETRMHDLLTIMQNNGVKMHYWCMVD